MRRGKKSLLMLAASVTTAALMILWPVRDALEVETAVVQRGELVQSVLLNGTVRYAQEQPLISLKSGVVSHVYVQAGQAIQKGELLFKMDTTAQEQALSALYEMQYAQRAALKQMDSVVSALTLSNEWEWRSYQTQLLASIEAAYIRAAEAGVMEAVYVKEGEYLTETSLLGMARGTERQIVASSLANLISGASVGNAAIAKMDKQRIPVVLAELSPADSSGVQTLRFEAGTENGLDDLQPGEFVDIELAAGVQPVSALIPISAIDADGMIWVVENGQAHQRAIELGECSSTHVCADLAWADQRVILHPAGYDLKDGMAVQVKK